tara:strand:- start:281 stop:580 length:300 start_codon:yes stop_codon:yes gene_type:complete
LKFRTEGIVVEGSAAFFTTCIFIYTQGGVCLLVWIPNFLDLKSFYLKREMNGMIFKKSRLSPPCVLLPSARARALSRSSNQKNEPYVSKYKHRGKKTKV